jgi:phosphatidylserine decarboxylase
MRLALTKYGWPQVVVFPVIVLAVMIICLMIGILTLPLWATVSIEAFLSVVLVWVLSFFRDPYRHCPLDKNLLLSPADGRITNIEMVEENNFVDGAALRIGIFLSIFDVHINRAPCNVKVERITYRNGRYKNAMNPQSSRVNESNELVLVRADEPKDKLIVRQISGAVARRIVCAASEGQELAGGEKFGMIKFGSRTELYVPAPKGLARADVKCLVQIGDKVKAGITPLVKYEIRDTKNA